MSCEKPAASLAFTGVDFGFSEPSKANTNLVLTGFTKANLSTGRLTTTFGTTVAGGGVPGSNFMLIHAN